MNSDAVILQSLETALSEVANGLDVAYVNTRLIPSQAQIYLEAHILPASASGTSIGDGHVRKTGTFQVTVVGNAGEGMSEINAVVATIENAFQRGRTVFADETARVMIDEPVSPGPLMPDGPKVRLPLSVSYLADFYNN